MRKKKRSFISLLLSVVLVLSVTACGAAQTSGQADTSDPAKSAAPEEKQTEKTQTDKNGDIYILFTSDVHCGVDEGFGYAGLKLVRDTLEGEGYETILVDDGDSVQGEVLGTVSKGEAMVELMNEIGYDVAIPGNHEFDYGTKRFLELVEMADYSYISCNFTYLDEPVLKPYVIKEAAGKKIAFVGVTTPTTVRGSAPANFQDENGQIVYGFMQHDQTGQSVYKAVQDAADAARAEGADFVFLVSHLGNEEICRPWTYADVIAATTGIDVVLDGHSHDTDQIVMKNKDGEEVTRSAVGTKMSCIGYSHISADGEIVETGIWSWPNKTPAPELLDIHNDIRDKIEEKEQLLAQDMNRVVAATSVRLTIFDPKEVDSSGNPIRMARRAETNLGDLCADAYRDRTGADIAFENGGAIRSGIEKGDITYGNIIAVHPFGNGICVLEVTGQQILDALEWGSRAVPGESGAFLQVSGLSYEINSAVDNPCKQDENGMFVGIDGARRVQNVMVGDQPLDPEKTYTLAGQDYMLLKHGDGFTMFDGAKVLAENTGIDYQALIDYIVETLGGTVGEGYEDLYGQGRITVLE